jgi:hypothetical protein
LSTLEAELIRAGSPYKFGGGKCGNMNGGGKAVASSGPSYGEDKGRTVDERDIGGKTIKHNAIGRLERLSAAEG